MTLQLKSAIGMDILANRPSITDDQRAQIMALALAVRVLLRRAPKAVADVLDTLKDIYRRAFHCERPNACDDALLDADTLAFIEAYFPEKIHRDFFGGKADCEHIRKFLRLADQRFIKVRIRSTSTFDDFVVIATIPGSGDVFLARITDDAATAPNMEEVGLIVVHREGKLGSGWPVFIGITVCVLLAIILEFGFDIKMPIYSVHIAALIGMLLGYAFYWGVNKLMDRAFTKRFPRLAPVV